MVIHCGLYKTICTENALPHNTLTLTKMKSVSVMYDTTQGSLKSLLIDYHNHSKQNEWEPMTLQHGFQNSQLSCKVYVICSKLVKTCKTTQFL